MYVGDGRFLACSYLSGADCNRVLSEHDENCGIAEHVRVVSWDVAKGQPAFQTRQATFRRKVTVDEDYELVFPERGPGCRLDPNSFEPCSVWVATKVQREFTAYHGATTEEAIHCVRLVIARALKGNGHSQLRSGWHRFTWSGYRVVVSPDLSVAVRYTTLHFERTPRETASGAPSRLTLRKRRQANAAGVLERFNVGDVLTGTVMSVVPYGAFIDVSGGFEGLLHRSELRGVTDDARTQFSDGELVTVRVISIDRERHRISLGLP